MPITVEIGSKVCSPISRDSLMTSWFGPSASFTSRLLALCTSAAAVAMGVCGCNVTAQPGREPPPPRVTVVAAQRKTLPVLVNPIGTTRALEDVTIRARVKGFLKEKHFQDGGLVKPDQLLLVI